MITEKNKFLELEEIKNLIEKVYAAQQAGNYVNFIYSNFSVSVLTMLGERICSFQYIPRCIA